LPGGSALPDLEQRGVVAASNPSSKPQTQKNRIADRRVHSIRRDRRAAPRVKITPQAINYGIFDE
jgi:hypothetical protein